MRGEFDKRADDLAQYLRFVRAVDTGALVTKDGSLFVIEEDEQTGEIVEKELPASVRATLKASTHLLLYNLTEATIRSAILWIVEAISKEDDPYRRLKDPLRNLLFERHHRAGKPPIKALLDAVLAGGRIDQKAFDAAFNSDQLLSGNVDAKKIRDVASEYGFECPPKASDVRNYGEPMVNTRKRRDDLSHGLKSFSEVGGDTMVSVLIDIHRTTVELLSEVVDEVDDFVAKKRFLEGT